MRLVAYAGDRPSQIGVPALVWLLAVLALATAPFVGDLPPWLTIGCAILGWWRLRLERRGGRLPPRGMALLVVSGAVGLLLLSGRLGVGLAQAAPALVAFMWIKLLELSGERDHLLCLAIACFLAGANLLDFHALTSWLWAGLTVFIAYAAAVRLRLGPQPAGWLPVRAAASVGLPALPLAIALFVFLPRPPSPIPVPGSSATSGVSEVMRPGDLAAVSLNPTVAFRVNEVQGQLPPLAQCYWRCLVLWTTDGSRWMRGGHARHAISRDNATAVGGTDVSLHLDLMPHRNTWLPIPDAPGPPPQEMRTRSGGVVEAPDRLGKVTSFPATMRVGGLLQDHDDLSLRAGLRLDSVQPNGVHPQVRTLAEELRADADTGPLPEQGRANAAVVERTLAWFRSHGFRYTTSPGEMAGDQVHSFLFERRAGFCGHFASSYALLLRLAGVPVRVLSGYRGGERNAIGGFVTIRQSHAHAWCEAWIGDEGWRRIDPTDTVSEVVAAQQAAQSAGAFGTVQIATGTSGESWTRSNFRSLAEAWDAVDAAWDRWAMGYDQDMQEGVLHRLGLLRWGTVGAIAGMVLVIAVVMAGTFLAWRRSGRDSDPVRRRLARLEARIAAAGVARESWEGPTAWGERAATRLPHAAEAIRDACARCDRARYGRTAPSAADLAAIDAAIAAVAAALRTRQPEALAHR